MSAGIHAARRLFDAELQLLRLRAVAAGWAAAGAEKAGREPVVPLVPDWVPSAVPRVVRSANAPR